MNKDCTTCNNSYLKDFAYLICSVKGLLSVEDVENNKECKDYDECE